MRYLVRFLIRLLLSVKVIGLKNIDLSSPTIFIPNHPSYLDGILLYAYLPKSIYLIMDTSQAKKFELILKGVNIITIDPFNPHSLKEIIHKIESGTSLVLFPEGRVSRTGSLMKVYDGISLIAKKTKVKLQPIIFSGLKASVFSHTKIIFGSNFFTKIKVDIRKPFTIESIKNNENLSKQQLTAEIIKILKDEMFHHEIEGINSENLFDILLEKSADIGRKKNIVKDINGTASYKKIILSSYILGNKFNHLTLKIERIGVFLPNSIANLVTLLSLFYLGKVPTLLNFSLGEKSLVESTEIADIKTIITSKAFIEAGSLQSHIKSLSNKATIIYLEDIKKDINILDKLNGFMKYIVNTPAKKYGKNQVILFTSGSESKPKGVILSHKNIISNIFQSSLMLDLNYKDKMFNPLPMFHSFGLTAGTFFPLLSGVETFLYPSPLHYKVIPEMSYNNCTTVLLGTPTFLKNYAKKANQYDFFSVRYVISGGEKLKDEVRSIWHEKFGLRILEGYGATETSPILTLNNPVTYKAGSVGKFLPGIEWKLESVKGIEEGGNLIVKGLNVFEGYLIHNIGFQKANEWYNTGDIVEIDDDGFVTIKSRLKRFAKLSGEMISLDLVEQICQKVYSNNKCAIISIPDDKKGEAILLFIDNKDFKNNELRSYILENGLSQLLIPSRVVFLNDIPYLGNGKIDYVELKNMVQN